MSDDKKRTGGFIEQIFHPPGCGHEHPDDRASDSESTGPSKAVSKEYRAGYDNIFGKKKDVGQS